MPGTIQVSVLEFKGMTSSSPPSSVFMKVSLGKTEYQTWDKGDFSFPLTTLRDSLTVTIQDSEGNDISKIGVHSMEIVEKGIWDDLFPLEGGGHVHMKLQFSLSEEERNRIRGMRESALKKKQREELSKDVRYSKMASDAGYSVTSYSPINHEVSGKEAGFPYPDTISKDLQPNNGKEATLQKHIAPNATDNSEESSSSKMLQRTEGHHMPVRKNDTELPRFVSEAPNLSQDNSPNSEGTESVVAKIKPLLLRLEDTPVSKHEKQFPLRKPASSIMKMISAFETSLVQEKKTPIIQVAAKSQSNRARKEGPLKDQVLSHVTKAPESYSGRAEYLTDLTGRLGNEEVSSSGRLLTTPQINSERLGNPSISGKLQQLPPDSMNKGKHIGFHNDIGKIELSAATRQLLISSTSNVQQAKAHETVTSELNSDHKEMNHRDNSHEVLRETSLGPRKDKFLSEIQNREEHVDLAKDLDENKHSPDAGQVTESSATKVDLAEADANMKSKSETYIEKTNKDRNHSSTDERSSALEASTVIKQIKEKGSVKLQPFKVCDWQGSDKVSFDEGLKEVKTKYSNEFFGTYEKQNTVVSHEDEQHQRESSTAWIFPNDARRMCVTTGVTAVIDLYDGCQAEGKHAVGSEEMKESESDSLNLRNRKPESWADNAFTGSVKHAMKIAILVGFGALVLLTRQREPSRKSSRKADDPFFRTLPYTDLQTSIKK